MRYAPNTKQYHTLCAGCDQTTVKGVFPYRIILEGNGEVHAVLAWLCNSCATNAMFPSRELSTAITNTLKGTS